jgi:hypothetical protein
MAANQLVQAGAVESEIWGIGRVPQRTQWADLPHRRPRSLLVSWRRGLLVVAPYHDADRAYRAFGFRGTGAHRRPTASRLASPTILPSRVQVVAGWGRRRRALHAGPAPVRRAPNWR